MKGIMEWLEADPGRTRKVVLISTIIIFLLITITLFVSGLFGVIIQESLIALFGTFTAFMVGIYGFFTGTSSDKTAKLADKAADILMKNLDKVDKSSKKSKYPKI